MARATVEKFTNPRTGRHSWLIRGPQRGFLTWIVWAADPGDEVSAVATRYPDGPWVFHNMAAV